MSEKSNLNFINNGVENTIDTLRLRTIGRMLTYPGRQILRGTDFILHLGKRPGPGQGTGQGTGLGARYGARTNHKFKLVLLGNSGAGKSSVLHRWISGRWLGEYGNMSTIGAAFCQTTFQYEDKTEKVDIWDTAGQERYRSMLTLYYRNADMGLIVTDLTEHATEIESNLRVWIGEYEGKSNNRNMILVGNKRDLLENENENVEESLGVKTLRKLGKEYDLPVVLVSAFTSEGVDKMVALVSDKVWKRLQASEGEGAGEGKFLSAAVAEEESFFDDEEFNLTTESRCWN